MKCFSILVIILFGFINNTIANTLIPYNENNLEAGEFLWIEVKTKKSADDLKSLINRRIHDNFFVKDFKIENGKKLFYVVTLNSSKKPDTYDFIIKGFNIKSLQIMDQNYTVLSSDYKRNIQENITQKLLIYIVISFAILVIFFIIYKKIKYRRMVRQKTLAESEYLKSIVSNCKTREDIEKIYKNRKEIRSKLNIEYKIFDNLIQQLDEIQYKKDWSTEELNSLIEITQKIEFGDY